MKRLLVFLFLSIISIAAFSQAAIYYKPSNPDSIVIIYKLSNVMRYSYMRDLVATSNMYTKTQIDSLFSVGGINVSSRVYGINGLVNVSDDTLQLDTSYNGFIKNGIAKQDADLNINSGQFTQVRIENNSNDASLTNNYIINYSTTGDARLILQKAFSGQNLAAIDYDELNADTSDKVNKRWRAGLNYHSHNTNLGWGINYGKSNMQISQDSNILHITQDRRVGINDITPDYMLDVAGDGGFDGIIYSNGDSVATREYARSVGGDNVAAIAGKADIASPSFTGTPTAPTATAGTNTTQIATTAFVQQALTSGSVPTRTGTVVSFDVPAVYNTILSPGTGNITFDFAGAVTNTEVVLYHNSITPPTFPAAASIIGIYYAGNNNEIRLIYRSNTEVAVVINNSNSSGYTNPEVIYKPSADVATTSSTGTAITGMNISILAGQRYAISGIIRFSSSSTGGMIMGTNWTAAPTVNEILFFGRANGTTSFTSLKTDASTIGYNAVNSGGSTAMFGTLANTNHWVTVTGEVVGGASDATLTILFAAFTAGQTETVFRNGTYLKVTKL